MKISHRDHKINHYQILDVCDTRKSNCHKVLLPDLIEEATVALKHLKFCMKIEMQYKGYNVDLLTLARVIILDARYVTVVHVYVVSICSNARYYSNHSPEVSCKFAYFISANYNTSYRYFAAAVTYI